MKSRIYAARVIGVLAVAIAMLSQADAQERNPKKSRLVWAAKPATPEPFEPPNRLIWRLSEILAAHKGQASWRLPVVKTRDFEADWISMAPGEKTKTVFYADDRVFWVVESGQMRVNIEGQPPFVAKKGFLVQRPHGSLTTWRRLATNRCCALKSGPRAKCRAIPSMKLPRR